MRASSLSVGRYGSGAVRAVQAHQALRPDAVERRHEGVGVDAHVGEAAEDVEHVVGMHRGQHQVAGQRRLHRDFGGFPVADLAHHDLVRVVAQDRAQALGEGQALLLVHRDLQNAGQLVFDRVFDRDDLVAAVMDFRQRRVQGGGLAGAGRTGHQQHAVRLLGQAAQDLQRRRVVAERFQRERAVGLRSWRACRARG